MAGDIYLQKLPDLFFKNAGVMIIDRHLNNKLD